MQHFAASAQGRGGAQGRARLLLLWQGATKILQNCCKPINKNFFKNCCKPPNNPLLAKCTWLRYLRAMTFHSLPYEPRALKATEARLEAIYSAAKVGLKGDALALAAGMLPSEYRQLIQFDPIAEYAEQKGRADGEREMATTLYTAAQNGDTKAALEVLKHAFKWTAPQAIQVQVEQNISITAALEEANKRVLDLTAQHVIDADAGSVTALTGILTNQPVREADSYDKSNTDAPSNATGL